MPPEIKRFNQDAPVEATGYFWLQLDSGQPFNEKEFDELARALHPSVTKPELFNLKWIVRGERMIIFPKKQEHAAMNYGFDQNGDGGLLHSAGHLEMFFLQGKYERTVRGHSMTLEDILDKDASNRYKTEVLANKLNAEDKDHFTIR